MKSSKLQIPGVCSYFRTSLISLKLQGFTVCSVELAPFFVIYSKVFYSYSYYCKWNWVLMSNFGLSIRKIQLPFVHLSYILQPCWTCLLAPAAFAEVPDFSTHKTMSSGSAHTCFLPFPSGCLSCLYFYEQSFIPPWGEFWIQTTRTSSNLQGPG